jgi:hypothetical protein
MNNIRYAQIIVLIMLVLFLGMSQAKAKSCDVYDCVAEEAPMWLNYPDVIPVQLDVYQDANSDNPRDILVCLTIANQGVFPVTESVEFDVYRSMNSGSEIFDQDVRSLINGRFSYPNNKILLMSDPRIPGSGTQPSSNSVSITYIVDYHDDIDEARETNNEITVVYSTSTAQARYDCDDGATYDPEGEEMSHDSSVYEDDLYTAKTTSDGMEADDDKDEWWADGATPSAFKDDDNKDSWSTGGATPSGVSVDDQKNEWWADGATPSAYH